MLEHENLTGEIIGAAIAVHTELGPGFLESIYEHALCVELRRRKLAVVRQVAVPIIYCGVEVGLHRLDLIVESQIVVELKAVLRLDDIQFAVVRSYLKAAQREHALLLNFARLKLEVKRVSASRATLKAV